MLYLMFVLVYWQVFMKLATLNQQVNPMNLPHISVADQFDETDIELLDGKVLTIRSNDSFLSAPPWEL